MCVGSLSSAKGIKSAKVGGTEAFALCRPPRPLDWFPTLAIRRETRPTRFFLDEEKSKTSYTTKIIIRSREPPPTTTTPCFTASDITTTNILVRPLPTGKRKRMTRTRLDRNGTLNLRPLGSISSHASRRRRLDP